MSFAITEQQQPLHTRSSAYFLQAHNTLPPPARYADPIRGESSRPVPGHINYQPRTPRIGHFDPDELTRRLHGVLADQRAHAERKRRAREAAAAQAAASSSHSEPSLSSAPGPIAPLTSNPPYPSQSQPQPQVSRPDDLLHPSASDYHHVPREAAKQFTRTATQDVMREHAHIHELHKRAFKAHMGNMEAARAGRTPETDLSRIRAQDPRRHFLPASQRRTGSDATAAMMMRPRQVDALESDTQLALNKWRRNSTGCDRDPTANGALITVIPVGSTSEATPGTGSDGTTPPEEPVQRFPAEPRTDWTQSDETARNNNSRPKTQLLSPLLRKADSLWGLRGRLKKDAEKEKGVVVVVEKEKENEKEGPFPPSGSKSPKSPKGKFFAKFIR